MIDRLLDQAVPPVPEPLRAAPIAAVRRRVRRRRAVRAAAVGCVTVVALVLGVVVALPARNDRSVRIATPDSSGRRRQVELCA